MFKALRDFSWTIFEFAILIAAGVFFTFVSIAEFTKESTASAWFFAFLAVLVILPGAFVAFYRERRKLERISPEAHRLLLDYLDAMIAEGMTTVEEVRRPRRIMHDPFNPAHPERGHPQVLQAVDFYSRAFDQLPPAYANDLRTAIGPALDKDAREGQERAEREQQASRAEDREAHPVYVWPAPVFVEVALEILGNARKELDRQNPS